MTAIASTSRIPLSLFPIIGTRKHAVLDWLVIAAIGLSPFLLGFQENLLASAFALIHAGGGIARMLMQDFAWSPLRGAPPEVHAGFDYFGALGGITIPLLFFPASPVGQATAVVSLLLLLYCLFTDYRGAA